MALIPLNSFKTKTKILTEFTATTATVNAYVAPIGVTSIILMAQVSNISTTSQTVSFVHSRNKPILADAQGQGAQAVGLQTYLVNEFEVPPNDAATVLGGKLILEQLDSVKAWASTTGTLQLTLSILETANN
ncbi:MAG: hypothetical protein EBU90_09990 [Proteobacteria bacterium]|nr:hypothetical protein [Pseudomonadota bacterium]NBP14918.1 hypothetical protein [bacterium]